MSLLPPNATPQERALEDAADRVSDVPVPLRDLWNPATCPEALLPWVAWGLSVDEWNPDWTAAQKRNVIASSVEVHRRKGTIGAVRRVINSFGLGFAIREWFQKSPAGTPHTFTLLISLDLIPAGVQESIIAAIRKVKPVRSDFDVQYIAGYLCQTNIIGIGNATIYDRFTASLT